MYGTIRRQTAHLVLLSVAAWFTDSLSALSTDDEAALPRIQGVKFIDDLFRDCLAFPLLDTKDAAKALERRGVQRLVGVADVFLPSKGQTFILLVELLD